MCKFCVKIFPKECNMLDHIRIHTKSKPFICDYESCNKSFSQLCNLKKHKKIHIGLKKFSCSFKNCKKKFSATYNLKVILFYITIRYIIALILERSHINAKLMVVVRNFMTKEISNTMKNLIIRMY